MSDVTTQVADAGVTDSADNVADVESSQAAGTPGKPARSTSKDPQNSADKKGAPPKPPAQKYKFGDFEGDENAVKSEIERGRQANRLMQEAQKRLEKANQIEKAEQARKDKVRKDLFGTLTKEYGLSREEALEQMARAIYDQEIVPSQESPEKRAIRERDAKIREYEEKERAAKQAEESKKQQAAQQQAEQQLYNELKTLLDSKKVPATRSFVRRIAQHLDAYMENGADIPTERAVDLAIEDFREEAGHFFDESTPEQIMEALGKERWHKLATKISNWALAQVNKGRQTKTVEPDLLAAPKPKDKRVDPNSLFKSLANGGVL